MEKAFYEGDFQRAVHIYEHLPHADSLSGRTHYLAGRSYQQLLRHREALQVLQKAREGNSSVALLQALGNSHEQLGRTSAAADIYQQALEKDSSNVPVRLALAGVYENRRQWREAADMYKKLVSQDSTRSLLRERLAHAYAALGNTEKAIQHYEKAHQLQPSNTSTTLALSTLQVETEQWEEALQSVGRTLERHPEESRLWRRRADIHFQQDSMETAAYEFLHALELGDTSATTLRKLGIARTVLENYPGALSSLRAAYRRDTTHAATSFYLGMVYRKLDSLDQSLTHLRLAVDLVSSGVLIDTFKELGQTYAALGKVPAAIEAYKMGLDLKPERSDLYFQLAVVYDRYYKDKSVVYLYYDKYLRERTDRNSVQQDILTLYAKQRMAALKEWMHFR